MLEIFRTLFAPPRHFIFLIVAAWLGLALAERRAPRHGLDREGLSNLIFYSLLGYLLGGRLLYAAAHLPAFLQSPASLVSPNTDLFDPLGGIAAGLGTAWILGRRKQLPLWTTLDALTPFFAVVAVGLGLAHLAAGTAFGKPTDVPWAIDLWNARRHPSQIYETLAALIILGIVLALRSPRPGHAFLAFAALSAAARLFLEAYRGDSTLIAGGVRLAQASAWLALLVIFVLFEVAGRNRSRPSAPTQATGSEESHPSPTAPAQ